jgi:hypothetical protein
MRPGAGLRPAKQTHLPRRVIASAGEVGSTMARAHPRWERPAAGSTEVSLVAHGMDS